MEARTFTLRPGQDHAARAALRAYAAATHDRPLRRRLMEWAADAEAASDSLEFHLTAEDAHNLIDSVVLREGASKEGAHKCVDWLECSGEDILLTVGLFDTQLWGIRATICGMSTKPVRQWLKIHDLKPQ